MRNIKLPATGIHILGTVTERKGVEFFGINTDGIVGDPAIRTGNSQLPIAVLQAVIQIIIHIPPSKFILFIPLCIFRRGRNGEKRV